MEYTHKEMREQTIVDKTTCDLCGKYIESDGAYDVNDVTISHRKGSHFPEGSWGSALILDICPVCWCDIILPFLRGKGVTRNYEEYDQ